MKSLLVLSFLFVTAVAQARSFKCIGEESKFETIEGQYLGEGVDAVVLSTSSIYSIFSKNGDDSLQLNRTQNAKKSGKFSDYPIQFVARQKDDLGSSTTTFAIPLGVFGGSTGKKFNALLAVTGYSEKIEHQFYCELVGY